MVILHDLSEVDERNFSQVPYIGTPLERQIRAHFTRADGLLNRSGYYSEVWGVPVNSSEYDSDSDDSSSSSSGASSDCVIISPSPFTGKRREVSLAIVVVGSKTTTMEIISRFLIEESVTLYREKYDLSGSGDENDVVAEPVGEGEYVTTINTNEPHYFYIYNSLIFQFNLFFPFTAFKMQRTQLHL
jgi:hypothetical protein